MQNTTVRDAENNLSAVTYNDPSMIFEEKALAKYRCLCYTVKGREDLTYI